MSFHSLRVLSQTPQSEALEQPAAAELGSLPHSCCGSSGTPQTQLSATWGDKESRLPPSILSTVRTKQWAQECVGKHTHTHTPAP